MAEREEQPRGDRAPAVAPQLARDVVDRRDMVGVEAVAQAKEVGKRANSQDRRVGGERELRQA